MAKRDQRTDLLRLIGRSPCGTETSNYLTSEGIRPQVIGAAVRAKLVIKVSARTYALTAIGQAALAHSRSRPPAAQPAPKEAHA